MKDLLLRIDKEKILIHKQIKIPINGYGFYNEEEKLIFKKRTIDEKL